ncbi:hypothetical protein V1477_006911 [Vespula maculifrons]|uniref:Uncharacterized protein n=1 Tax=Vespula maculifrons TaxID=7453 RepID=A0ABD2CH13_VESMC
MPFRLEEAWFGIEKFWSQDRVLKILVLPYNEQLGEEEAPLRSTNKREAYFDWIKENRTMR